jgi:hypothetical protein
MKNLFDPQESQQFIARYRSIPPELALRVYTSRLIGGDPDLVLHGGQYFRETAVKNIVGRSGDPHQRQRDRLAAIEPGILWAWSWNLCASWKNSRPFRGGDGEPAADPQDQSTSPDPSVEVLLHAFLPQRYIDHPMRISSSTTNQKQWRTS